MNKIIGLLALLLFSFTLQTGCGSGAHIGDVKQSGDWIYYGGSSGAAYRVDLDGSGKMNLE